MGSIFPARRAGGDGFHSFQGQSSAQTAIQVFQGPADIRWGATASSLSNAHPQPEQLQTRCSRLDGYAQVRAPQTKKITRSIARATSIISPLVQRSVPAPMGFDFRSPRTGLFARRRWPFAWSRCAAGLSPCCCPLGCGACPHPYSPPLSAAQKTSMVPRIE